VIPLVHPAVSRTGMRLSPASAWRRLRLGAWPGMVRQDVLVARDERFRSPAWDEQIEAAFEQRPRRARPARRLSWRQQPPPVLLSSHTHNRQAAAPCEDPRHAQQQVRPRMVTAVPV